jgi:hypothetical protein
MVNCGAIPLVVEYGHPALSIAVKDDARKGRPLLVYYPSRSSGVALIIVSGSEVPLGQMPTRGEGEHFYLFNNRLSDPEQSIVGLGMARAVFRVLKDLSATLTVGRAWGLMVDRLTPSHIPHLPAV